MAGELVSYRLFLPMQPFENIVAFFKYGFTNYIILI